MRKAISEYCTKSELKIIDEMPQRCVATPSSSESEPKTSFTNALFRPFPSSGEARNNGFKYITTYIGKEDEASIGMRYMKPTYGSRDSGSVVAYASYLIISRFSRKYGSPPHGVYFNKVMSLLYRQAKEEGIDIKLPHCWYRYGDEVVKFLMPHSVRWDHEDANKTTVKWQGIEPDELSDSSLTKKLKQLVQGLVDKYSEENVNEAIEKVYSYAPFQFQREFRVCKDSVLDAMKTQVSWRNYASDVLWPCVESACSSFPKQEFPEVATSLPVFRALVESVIVKKQTDPDYALAKELLEEFWEWFCYFLRVNPKANENVPRETIEFWKERLDWESERYRRIFGDHIVQLASENPTIDKHPILGPAAELRRNAASEERRIISSFDEDFDDLDSFLQRIRSGYRMK